mmetsp:Transcript_52707/g.151936  ORF Transcript_52707/g.151936 Transcript_52707/m.151936 type:complete len:235 (+) Transcript_52707:948-1652(+)
MSMAWTPTRPPAGGEQWQSARSELMSTLLDNAKPSLTKASAERRLRIAAPKSSLSTAVRSRCSSPGGASTSPSQTAIERCARSMTGHRSYPFSLPCSCRGLAATSSGKGITASSPLAFQETPAARTSNANSGVSTSDAVPFSGAGSSPSTADKTSRRVRPVWAGTTSQPWASAAATTAAAEWPKLRWHERRARSPYFHASRTQSELSTMRNEAGEGSTSGGTALRNSSACRSGQ